MTQDLKSKFIYILDETETTCSERSVPVVGKCNVFSIRKYQKNRYGETDTLKRKWLQVDIIRQQAKADTRQTKNDEGFCTISVCNNVHQSRTDIMKNIPLQNVNGINEYANVIYFVSNTDIHAIDKTTENIKIDLYLQRLNEETHTNEKKPDYKMNTDSITLTPDQAAFLKPFLEKYNSQQGSGDYVIVLGRKRKITRMGRKKMISYKGQKISLTEARLLEKKLRKSAR